MTKSDLVQFKVNQFLEKREVPALIAFIVKLVDNPKIELQNVLDEVKVETTKRLAQLDVTKANLQASDVTLRSLDIDQI